MGRRHANHRLVKIHFSYTVEEAARLLGVHKNTIRRWIKDALPTVDSRRPALIRGHDLVQFLESRRRSRRQTCPSGHFYCVKCRAPKEPAGDFAEYIPITEQSGNLRGICPTCDGLIHRRVNLRDLDRVRGGVEVTLPRAHLHIGEGRPSSVHGDLGQEP